MMRRKRSEEECYKWAIDACSKWTENLNKLTQKLTTLAQDDGDAAHFPAQRAAAEQNIHMFVVRVHCGERNRFFQLLHHSVMEVKGVF